MVRAVTTATLLALIMPLFPHVAGAQEQAVDESGTEPTQPQPDPAKDEGPPRTGSKDSGAAEPASEQEQEQEQPTVVAPDVDLKEVAPDPASSQSSGPEPSSGDDTASSPSSPKETDATPASGPEDKAPPVAHDPGSDPIAGTDSASDEDAEPTTPEPPPTLLPEDADPELVMIERDKPPEAESLVMLGAEVRPGTSTRLTWQPDTTMAGLTTPTPVLVLNGAQPGPNLCLTAAVHGDELNGIEIVRRVMYTIEPENLSGRIIGVPIVNVQGFRRGSRYLADRRDLNRHFPGDPDGSLASRIAHSLFTDVIQNCDMLVDVHTGSLKRTNLPQMRADMNRPEVATFSRGFDEMAVVHSSGSTGMLRVAASNAGITAITMEAGESTRFQQHQIEAGVNAINSLLEKQNMLNRLFVWGEPEPVYYDSSWVRANHGGILNSQVDLGDEVVAGQPLGTVTDPITNAQHTIKADEDGRIIGMAVDQVVMAGFAAYHLGTAAQAPEVAE